VNVTVFFSGYLGGEVVSEKREGKTHVNFGSFCFDYGYCALFMTSEVAGGLENRPWANGAHCHTR
jgi:hypothetical protein